MKHIIDSKKSLKPCPFCGGTALMLVEVDGKSYTTEGRLYVQCEHCNASTDRDILFKGVTEEEVADLWNMREEEKYQKEIRGKLNDFEEDNIGSREKNKVDTVILDYE